MQTLCRIIEEVKGPRVASSRGIRADRQSSGQRGLPGGHGAIKLPDQEVDSGTQMSAGVIASYKGGGWFHNLRS
jgi:hypothetical protein